MKRFRSFWFSTRGAVIASIVGVAALLALGAYGSYESDREWQIYSVENGCVLIQKTESSIIWMPAGKDGTPSPMILPGHSTYRCRAGFEVTR